MKKIYFFTLIYLYYSIGIMAQTVMSVSPNIGTQGDSITVQVGCSGFTMLPSHVYIVQFRDAPTSGNTTTFTFNASDYNSYYLKATGTIPSTAYVGLYYLEVTDENTNAMGMSNPDFTVNASPSCPNINITITHLGNGSVYAEPSGGQPPYSYIWSTIPTQNTDTVTGLMPGDTYTLTVTDHNGCKDTAMVSIPLGIVTQYGTSSINLYPNPTTGSLTITGLDTEQEVVMYDYMGHKIYNKKTGEVIQQLDISAQPNGIYLIQIFSKYGFLLEERKVLKVD